MNAVSDGDRQPSSSFQGSQRQESTDYTQVNDRLEWFVIYFVKEFEAKCQAYHLLLEGEVQKAGKFSNVFADKIGQAIGGAAGGLLGLFLGASLPGAKAGATVGKAGGQKLGNMVGNKKRTQKVAKLLTLIELSRKDKTNFRRVLVEAGFDIFQSLEMQFMRVTTSQGPKQAMHILAKDATNRATYYLKKKEYALLTESVILGVSKIETVLGVPIATSKIKTPGFEIIYKHGINKFSEEKYYTSSIYEKVGLVIERKPEEITRYYEKKDGKSRTDKYGYRRLFTTESWNKINEMYISSNLLKSKQFLDYRYILNSKDLVLKSQEILKTINLDDKVLTEERITKIIEEVKDELIEEINVLKNQSHRYAEDHKILISIDTNLKNLKADEYLKKLEQYFEEAKHERQNIAISIEASRVENKETINQLSQKQDIYHDDDKKDHRNTQEGIERVKGAIEGNSRKINEIHEAVVIQKIEQTKESIWFEVRKPVKSFTGRDDELKRLHKALQCERGPVVISQTTAITGLGGIGKSEVARKYAYDYRECYNGNIMWINAETKVSIKESFQELATKLKIHIKNAGENDSDVIAIARKVYEYFKDTKCLFLFDNAEEYKNINAFLLLSLSPDNKKPHILITSRNQDWEVEEEGTIEVIKLDDFTLDEAVEFIKKVLNIEVIDNTYNKEIIQLAIVLQCFPLALQQATAYIREKNAKLKSRGTSTFKITDYLAEYGEEARKTDLLNFKSKHGSDRYIKTVYTTWKITFKNIEQKGANGRLALDILDILAYFDADKVHIENFFLNLVGDEEILWSSIELLKQYSMINVEGGVSNIHRLVQEVIRSELKKQGNEENVLRITLDLINREFINRVKGFESFTIERERIKHITSVWNYASEHDKLIDDFYLQSIYTNKETPLHLLTKNGNNKAIRAIITHIEIDTSQNVFTKIVNCQNESTDTPLLFAVDNNNLDLVKYLVTKGADINHVKYTMEPDYSGLESFLGIMRYRSPKSHKMRDRTYNTALLEAANKGYWDIVRFLVENGANIKYPKDCIGRLAIHSAAGERGNLDVVKFLVERGADVNSINNDWMLPLHYTAPSCNLNMIKYLVENGSELNKQTKRGGCAMLHYAVTSGKLAVVKYLVEKGADVNVKNKNGKTPLQLAKDNYHDEIVQFLTNYHQKASEDCPQNTSCESSSALIKKLS